MGENPFDIDSVFRYLVPDEYKRQLRDVGITGGISAAVSCWYVIQLRLLTNAFIAPSCDRSPGFLHSSVPD